MNKQLIKKAINHINKKNQSQGGVDIPEVADEHKRFMLVVASFFNDTPVIHKANKDRILSKIRKDTSDYRLTEPKNKKKISKHFSIYRHRWTAVAAVLIILLVGAGTYFIKNGPDNSNITVQAHANEKLIFFLPDSSEVWLNKGSKIQYKSNFLEKREVILTGEGFFDVNKYKNNIFEIKTKNACFKVLGTTFNIKSNNSGDVEVKLYTGKINVVIQNSEGIILSPMQKLNYIVSEAQSTVSKIDDDFDWKSNVYKFIDKPLDELIIILNNLYNVNIQLKRDEFKKNIFSGKVILSEPIDNILDKICINTGISLLHRQDSIILY